MTPDKLFDNAARAAWHVKKGVSSYDLSKNPDSHLYVQGEHHRECVREVLRSIGVAPHELARLSAKKKTSGDWKERFMSVNWYSPHDVMKMTDAELLRHPGVGRKKLKVLKEYAARMAAE